MKKLFYSLDIFATLQNRRFIVSKRRFLGILFVVFLIFGTSSSIFAQGWRMYIDQIKQEAQNSPQSTDENDASRSPEQNPDFPSNETNAPVFPNPSSQSSETPPSSPTESPSSSRPTQRRKTSSNNLGILDFSEMLGEDDSLNEIAEADSDETPEISEIQAGLKPSLPSYRNFPEMKNDACLNDVFFLNPRRGWAVGDRGTIWTTFDGGENWLLIDFPVDCNLFGVHFLNDQLGFIVGGSVLPGSPNGRGIILRTLDGGRSWSEINVASFPILRQVRVLDQNRVQICGDSSELYPGGVFSSVDSGETWSPVSGNRHEGWKTLFFDESQKFGIGVGSEGSLQSFQNSVRPIPTPTIGKRRIVDLSRGTPNDAIWIAGDSGLIMTSTDGGENWRRPNGILPNDASTYFDFSAIFSNGPNIWVAGSPGSLIFFSSDGGESWNAGFSGIRVPIRKISFVDPRNGWAVGELGNIIATNDGGQSWRVQREGGRRLAYLGLFAKSDDVPFEAFVQFSGEEGYLGLALLLAREENREKTNDEIPDSRRIREAAIETGASGSLQSGTFILDSEDLDMSIQKILERFDRENDGKGLERFRENLVRQIRIWRPDVLLISEGKKKSRPIVSPTENSSRSSASSNDDGFKIATKQTSESPKNDSLSLDDSPQENLPPDISAAENQPSSRTVFSETNSTTPNGESNESPKSTENDDVSFAQFIERELPSAIRSAQDPTAYPEHLTQCRLEPWTVSKVQRVQKTSDSRSTSNRIGQNIAGNVLKNSNFNESAVLTPRESSDFSVSTSFFCSTLGRSVAEIGRNARDYLRPEFGSVPAKIEFKTLFDRTKTPASDPASPETSFTKRSNPGFFGGLELQPGGEARRQAQRGLIDSREQFVERAALRRQNLGIILNITKNFAPNDRSTEILLSQIRQSIRGADPEMAIEYLNRLGEAFYRQGNLVAAEDVFSIVALEFPTNPKSREALVWLVQYYAGKEPNWRTQEKNRAQNSNGRLTQNGFDGDAKSRLAIDSSKTNSRHRNADQLGKIIREFHPELYMSPEVRFPLATIQRERGFNNNALQYYLNRSLVSKNDLWGIRARAEFWLLTPNRDVLPPEERLCPLSVFNCQLAPSKPFLDGVLEPEVWNAARGISLSEERLQTTPKILTEEQEKRDKLEKLWQEETKKLSSDLGTFVSALYDDEFLYFGVQCRKNPNFDYFPDESPRVREADLTGQDRIEIQFDLDRDYATAYRFVFDSRGWVNESSWSDANWNPNLFVARGETDEFWTLEIAIPLEEICERPPSRYEIWGVSMRRIVPNVGMECWNVDRSVNGENGFGFLTFGLQ